MARRLESFPASATARYPWDAWLDGHPWELTKGEDFGSEISTFRTNAQYQAKKRGGKARTRAASSDGRAAVIIQFERA